MPFEYLDQSAPDTGKFEYLDEPSVGGFAKNVLSNAGRMLNPVNIAESGAGMVKTGALDIPKEATDTLAQVVGNTVAGEPIGETPMAKRATDIAGSEEVQNPKEFAYKNPLDVAMQAAPVVGAFLPEAEAATIPKAEVAPVAEVPKTEPPPPAGPAGSTPKELPPSSPSAGIPFQNEAQEALGKAKEVKDYVSRGYEGFAKKPGAIADVADYIQGKSQMAAAQQMGATPLQARQVGHEGMRAIGQYALDNGIVGPTVGLRGMRLRNTELLDNAGKTLGDLRKQADSVRNPLETPVDTLQAVRQKLDPEYLSGTRTGGAEYQMALKNIENSDPSFEGMAKTATKLNKLANEANRLNQPHGPYTDVANEMSRINNERIKQLLGPQKAAQYEQALKEYGVNKKISEFLKRKEAGEVKRLGPGSLTSNLTQKMMDEIGYKTAAKVGNKVSTSILKNPSIAKSLPSLFKEFTHQIEDVGQEVTGMYEGGVVPKDVGAYVQTRNQKSGSRNESDLAEAKR